jgi:hypothetical protein
MRLPPLLCFYRLPSAARLNNRVFPANLREKIKGDKLTAHQDRHKAW